MNKKHIFFIQNVSVPQQGAIDIYYYAKELAKDPSYKVSMIIKYCEEDIENVDVYSLGKGSYLNFIFKAFQLLKRENKNFSISYAYFFAQHPFSVFLQFFVSRFLKIKTIYDVVSGPIGRGVVSYISFLTIKIGVYLSDKYVVIDEGLVKKLRLSKKKLHSEVPMGFDETLFNPFLSKTIYKEKGTNVVFTYVGTLDKKRNLHIFLKSFIRVLSVKNNIQLYFIGEGSGVRELKKMAEENLGKRIFFLGRVDHKKIPSYINGADVLVSYVPQTHYFDLQPPTKLIEYLACDKIVIATATSAQKKILGTESPLLHNDSEEETYNKIHDVLISLKHNKKINYSNKVIELKWSNCVDKLKKLFNYT